jgi:hypothetical protein
MKKLFLLIVTVFGFTVSFSQIITTVAGTGFSGYAGDWGPATAAELYGPSKVYADSGNGFLIVDEYNHVLRKVTGTGTIVTIAGNSIEGYSGDGGMATAAELNYPTGVCMDTSGNIYLADLRNNVVRKVSVSGIITTIAGKDSAGYSGDGGPATAAKLNFPFDLTADKSGNIYIADAENNRIRKVSTSGIMSTFAGNGTNSYSGDGGPATAAELNYPAGICLDNSGNICIADIGNNVIRKVSVGGIISTIAGNNIKGYSGDGGMATNAELNEPFGICADTLGNIYIGDYGNNKVRKVSPSGIISTVAGNGTKGYNGDGGLATAAELHSPWGVCVNDSGNLLIADYLNSVVRKVSKPWLAGVKELISSNEELRIYPNPNNGKFSIKSSGGSGQSTVEIYNVLGEKVYSKQWRIKDGQLTIDLSDKASGVYMYRVVSESGELTGMGKFIKE